MTTSTITVVILGAFLRLSVAALKCPEKAFYMHRGAFQISDTSCYICVNWTTRFNVQQTLYPLYIWNDRKLCQHDATGKSQITTLPEDILPNSIVLLNIVNHTDCPATTIITILEKLNKQGFIQVLLPINNDKHFAKYDVGFISRNASQILIEQFIAKNNNSIDFQGRRVFFQDEPTLFTIPIASLLLQLLACFTVILGTYLNGRSATRHYKTALRLRRQDEKRKLQQLSTKQQFLVDKITHAERVKEWSMDTNPFVISSTSTDTHKVILLIMYLATVLFVFYYFASYLVYVILIAFTFASASALNRNFNFLLNVLPWTALERPFQDDLTLIGGYTKTEIALNCIFYGVSITWLICRHMYYAWIVQNILAISICVSILRDVRITKFKLIFYALWLAAAYDLFMVFITPLFAKRGSLSVMVEVALGGNTGETIPVLLKFPRSNREFLSCHGAGKLEFGLLGLGDIILPGILLAYFHVHGAVVYESLIYYYASCGAYIIGLAFTFLANFLTLAAQPALIYLIPTITLLPLFLAWFIGEFKLIWESTIPNEIIMAAFNETINGRRFKDVSAETTTENSNLSENEDTSFSSSQPFPESSVSST